ATLGLFPAGPDARYWGTPPELFPVGSTGCDGDHYGFVLHAPELDLDELPYAHYCPMDSDGGILVGSTTAKGIASVMAWHSSYDCARQEVKKLLIEKKKLLIDVASFCSIQPDEERDPAIPVPGGWRLLPSSDGIGTLAPAKLFSREPVTALNRYGPST